MRIAVTGANGLVGSRLVQLLAQRGHTVLALGRGPQRVRAQVGYFDVDLTDPVAAGRALDGTSAEALVHCASMTEVDACERAPEQAWAANVDATESVARAARRLGAHVVQVSTDYVFDGDAGPYVEDAIPNPRGVYALTKHVAEQAVRALAPSWAVARTAVVFGWPAAGRPNFGSWVVSTLAAGKPVKLFSDQLVSPSLADSVAEMLGELTERRLSGSWHIAGADVVDRVAFGRALCERLGFAQDLIVPTRLADAALAAPRPRSAGLMVERARAELTAKPLRLDEALDRFVRTYRAAAERREIVT